jgi:hypothetical protein
VEYQNIKGEIEVLEKRTAQPTDTSEEINRLKKERAEITKKVDECKEKLSAREQNERFRTRVKELLEEEKLLAQQIAELEGQEFLCEEFIKTKVELLENSINSKFKFVRFKLLNSLVNGSVEECCEALINGVPFSSANTASQINAGLDIINALSEHYGVGAPIFIDNRESINRILHCSSQLINLIVSEDPELKIQSYEDKAPVNNTDYEVKEEIKNNAKVQADAIEDGERLPIVYVQADDIEVRRRWSVGVQVDDIEAGNRPPTDVQASGVVSSQELTSAEGPDF